VVCVGQSPLPLESNRAIDVVCPEVKMSAVPSDRWLSVDEIAAYLGVKRYTIYKWIERKKMPAHTVGSLWKFRTEEIDHWVRSGAAGHGGEAESGSGAGEPT